jgi:Flp pilus assembly protein TadG
VSRRFLRANGGASAVEFALVLLPFLVFVFGVMEFGRAMWTREALESVTNASARCMGVLHASCATSGVYDQARTISYVQTKARDLKVTIPANGISLSNNTSCAGVTGFSRVAVTYQFKTFVPLILPGLKNGIPFNVVSCFPNQPVSS